MNRKPRNPEEALEVIKEAASTGRISFAPDTLTAQYDEEIQRIFRALYREKNGRESKRAIWTGDGQPIGVLLDYDTETKDYTPESHGLVRRVGERLGIALTPYSIWEEAAAALRDKERDSSTRLV